MVHPSGRPSKTASIRLRPSIQASSTDSSHAIADRSILTHRSTSTNASLPCAARFQPDNRNSSALARSPLGHSARSRSPCPPPTTASSQFETLQPSGPRCSNAGVKYTPTTTPTATPRKKPRPIKSIAVLGQKLVDRGLCNLRLRQVILEGRLGNPLFVFPIQRHVNEMLALPAPLLFQRN